MRITKALKDQQVVGNRGGAGSSVRIHSRKNVVVDENRAKIHFTVYLDLENIPRYPEVLIAGVHPKSHDFVGFIDIIAFNDQVASIVEFDGGRFTSPEFIPIGSFSDIVAHNDRSGIISVSDDGGLTATPENVIPDDVMADGVIVLRKPGSLTLRSLSRCRLLSCHTGRPLSRCTLLSCHSCGTE